MFWIENKQNDDKYYFHLIWVNCTNLININDSEISINCNHVNKFDCWSNYKNASQYLKFDWTKLNSLLWT